MTETTRKGWVMVYRDSGWIADWTFSPLRKLAIDDMCEAWGDMTRRQVLRRYKPVKATLTIRLEDE